MSLPDLNVYELKKSTFPVHYVYAYHSINSTHTVYRERAFEFFDTIFCVGPHHLKELREEESHKALKPRRLLEHGSVKLDTVIAQYSAHEDDLSGKTPFILLAPSWGECSFAEDPELVKTMIEAICSRGWIASLRLHPMTVRHRPELATSLLKHFEKHHREKLFTVETDMNDNSSLKNSHVMISDWSGAATEYAFALSKPVLFIDTPQKLNNPAWNKFSTPGIEDFIRHEIGLVLKPERVSGDLMGQIESLLKSRDAYKEKIKSSRDQWIFHVGRSAQVGAQHLTEIYKEFSR